jgi:hypothetical protein
MSLLRSTVIGVVAAVCLNPPVQAQVRGVYPPGMTAVNSGITPDPGFSYANNLLDYERDKKTGPNGETIATGKNSVVLEMNSFVWVSEKIALLGGAKYSFAATIPIAKNSLSSDDVGQISGATGLGDSYFLPFILGWQTPRADLRLMYGFLAPTGRFNAGSNDNVGSGYWTHAVSSGQTFYLSEDRATTVSTFELYESHQTQAGTGIRPGDTMNLDYSLTRVFLLKNGLRLQPGLVGYEQLQTSARRGPQITATQAEERYRVNAVGLALTFFPPRRKLSFGFRAFKEFSTESTFEGYSLQGFVALAL